MILYHKHSALHCPIGCCAESIVGLLKEQTEPITHEYILVRDPLERLKALYLLHPKGMRFKVWARSVYISPQVEILSNPITTIRAERFSTDIKGYFRTEATIDLIPHPEIQGCLATIAHVRRIYKDDYIAWDNE